MPARLQNTNCSMPLTPSINWWRGALLPHESIISFAAKFMALNGLTSKKTSAIFSEVLRKEVSDSFQFSSFLNEDPDALASVLRPRVNVENLSSLSWIGPPQYDRVKYCPDCIRLGYHAYFHNVHWLSCCIFHSTPLEILSVKNKNYSSFIRQMLATKELYESECSAWPVIDQSKISEILSCNEFLLSLSTWVEKIQVVSENSIWHSSLGGFKGERAYRQAVGRLRSIAEIENKVTRFFSHTGVSQELKVRKFPRETLVTLKLILAEVNFEVLLSFYKYTSIFNRSPPHFFDKLQQAKDQLIKLHGECHCCWGVGDSAWASHWHEVDPTGWPYWLLSCPYEFILQCLDEDWGYGSPIKSSRAANNLLFFHFHTAKILKQAGFIKLLDFTSDSGTYLFVEEWLDPMGVTDLLEVTAEWELESALVEYKAWVKYIDDGHSPCEPYMSQGNTYLCETVDGLELIRFIPCE